MIDRVNSVINVARILLDRFFSLHRNIKIKTIANDHYEAIEVPYVNAIPSDYTGVMGVPLTFLDDYNPDQFEILGLDDHRIKPPQWKGSGPEINGKAIYRRLIIRHKHNNQGEGWWK